MHSRQAASMIPCLMVVLHLSRIVTSQDSVPDASALTDFKNKVSDPDQNLLSWTTDQPKSICSWEHVFCGAGTLNVVKLTLSNSNLSGFLSPKLWSLPFLTQLLLSENHIGGSIPPEIGNLTNLQYLYLQNNILTGAIPDSLTNLKEMEFLNLSFNNLGGRIPPSLLQKFTFDSFMGNSFPAPSPPNRVPSMAPAATVLGFAQACLVFSILFSCFFI